MLKREKSTFVDWQRVKVQELSDQVSPQTWFGTHFNIRAGEPLESNRPREEFTSDC